MAVEFTDQNFEKEVLKSKEPVMVDFWAAWCGSCQTMGPIVDELAEEFKGKLKVGKMNAEKNLKVPDELGIMSLPTIKIFKKGKVVQEFVGLQAKETLKEALEKLI